MHRNPLSPVVLAAALTACATQPELLNSERIQQRFGNYGIDVVDQEGSVRRSNLYSIENGNRITRTYAVVKFTDPVHALLANDHRAVVAGESIGATFDAAGWEIRKQTIHIGTVYVPSPQHSIAMLMQLDEATTLGLHVYRLVLEDPSQSIHYATIVEAHHPEYLQASDLLALYGSDDVTRLDPGEVETIQRVLLN